MKRYISIVLTIVLVFTLVACQNKNQSENNEEKTNTITVYMNDFEEEVPGMFKEATGYDINVVAGNGAETMSRIEAEKGNPQWDVVWIDAVYDMYNLSKDDSLLKDWVPKNADNIKSSMEKLIPEDKSFYPTGVHAAGVLVYRTDKYDDSTAPKSVDDLTDSRFINQIGMADPGVAAPAYPLVAYHMERLGLEKGKEFFSTLFNQGLKVYPKNPQVVQALASGEITVALLQETNAYDMMEAGEPIEWVWSEPAGGSTRVVGISADSKNLDIAKEFVEFLLDPETQEALTRSDDEGFFEPSVEGAEEHPDRPKEAELGIANYEWGAEHLAEIKSWFADLSAQ